MATKQIPELPAASSAGSSDLVAIRQGSVDKKLTLELLQDLVAPDATATNRGIVELATNAEAATGTDTERAITPAALKSVIDAIPSVGSATTSSQGVVELATAAEVQTGTDTARAITPSGLSARTATESRTGVIELATSTEVNTGTDTSRAVTPAGLAARTSTESRAGIIEIATQTEANTGTDDTRAITPLKLKTITDSIVAGGAVPATESVAGLLEIATQVEVNAGSSATLAVTPAYLAGRTSTESRTGVIALATQTEVNNGLVTSKAVTPATLKPVIDSIVAGAAGPSSETTSGLIEIATQVETNAGVDDARAITPLKLATSYTRKDIAQTISGAWVFNTRPSFNGGTSGVDSPFTVDSTFVVTNLNADLLDGQEGSYYRDASNLNAGTVPDARFPATLPVASGANLTNLNASNLASGTVPVARIPTAIPATSIGTGSVDNTELGYLNGVTSAIQTQLNTIPVKANESETLIGWNDTKFITPLRMSDELSEGGSTSGLDNFDYSLFLPKWLGGYKIIWMRRPMAGSAVTYTFGAAFTDHYALFVGHKRTTDLPLPRITSETLTGFEITPPTPELGTGYWTALAIGK